MVVEQEDEVSLFGARREQSASPKDCFTKKEREEFLDEEITEFLEEFLPA